MAARSTAAEKNTVPRQSLSCRIPSSTSNPGSLLCFSRDSICFCIFLTASASGRILQESSMVISSLTECSMVSLVRKTVPFSFHLSGDIKNLQPAMLILKLWQASRIRSSTPAPWPFTASVKLFRSGYVCPTSPASFPPSP